MYTSPSYIQYSQSSTYTTPPHTNMSHMLHTCTSHINACSTYHTLPHSILKDLHGHHTSHTQATYLMQYTIHSNSTHNTPFPHSTPSDLHIYCIPHLMHTFPHKYTEHPTQTQCEPYTSHLICLKNTYHTLYTQHSQTSTIPLVHTSTSPTPNTHSTYFTHKHMPTEPHT